MTKTDLEVLELCLLDASGMDLDLSEGEVSTLMNMDLETLGINLLGVLIDSSSTDIVVLCTRGGLPL